MEMVVISLDYSFFGPPVCASPPVCSALWLYVCYNTTATHVSLMHHFQHFPLPSFTALPLTSPFSNLPLLFSQYRPIYPALWVFQSSRGWESCLLLIGSLSSLFTSYFSVSLSLLAHSESSPLQGKVTSLQPLSSAPCLYSCLFLPLTDDASQIFWHTSDCPPAHAPALLLTHLSPPLHLAPTCLPFSSSYLGLGFHLSVCLSLSLSRSLSVCHLAVSNQTGRLPLFMTADMWQFPFVNDKKCANYLSGCFAANQTLTSCERVAAFARVCESVCLRVRVWVCWHERKLDKCDMRRRLLLNFNHLKSFFFFFRESCVEIGLPFHRCFY